MNTQNNTEIDPGLRKAAILVASLDRDLADTMLEQLGPQRAGQVRQIMVEMDQIDPKEQRRVIDEFFRNEPAQQNARTSGVELAGIELDRRPMRRSPPTAVEPPQQIPLPPDARPFHFLDDAEAAKLFRALEGERPQTIALVLSHLPAVGASQVLTRLPGALQADVLRRLVNLEETDPTILREVERALESRLSQQVHMQRRRTAGMKAVADILAASDGRLAARILDNLAEHDRPLAGRLGPPIPDFDDLATLDDAALSAVFKEVEPELALTALVGASERLIDRILRRFPQQQAKTVRNKLECPGPIRLSDVEEARRRIAELARRLAMEGKIQLAQQHTHDVTC